MYDLLYTIDAAAFFFTAWYAGGRMQSKDQQGAAGIYFV